VTANQPRYLLVTPRPAGAATPVALRVTSPDYPCLDLYVNALGQLTTMPVFRTPDQWGTVQVRGANVVPDTDYEVREICGSHTTPAGTAKTSIWGDVVGPFMSGGWTNPDGQVDIITDVTAILDKFRNVPSAPAVYRVDLVGTNDTGVDCRPDGRIDIIDVTVDLDAFRGISYQTSTRCSGPCKAEAEAASAVSSAR
jgi:hypothetical protein